MSLLKNRFFPLPASVILVIIILLALAVRLIYLVLVVGPASYPTNIDSIEHHLIAMNIVNGQGYSMYGHPTAYRAPFLTYYMALCYQLFGVNFLVVRLGIIIMSLMLIIAIYRLGKEVFGSRVGLWAALISAIYPHLIFYNARIYTETPFTLFSILAMIFFIKYIQSKSGLKLLLTAFFLALSILTRPVGLVLLVLMVFFLLWKPRFWLHLKPAAVLILFTLLLILPWMVRNFLVFGKFVPLSTQGGIVLWISNNHYVAHHPYYRGSYVFYQHLPGTKPLITVDEGERTKYAIQYFLEFLKEHPEDVFRLLWHKTIRFWEKEFQTGSSNRWMYEYFYIGILILTTGGLIWSIFPAQKKIIFLLMLVAANFISALIFWAGPRVRLPAEPVLIIFAALILEQARKKIMGLK